MLKEQKGFGDELSFYDKDKGEAMAVSFRKTKQDADEYQRDIDPQVSRKMQDAIEGTTEIRSFEAAHSTWYHIHAA